MLSLAAIAISVALFTQNRQATGPDRDLPQSPAPSVAAVGKVMPTKVTRITTASRAPVQRVATSPATRVERIRGADLASLFPDQEILLVGEKSFVATVRPEVDPHF